MPDETDYLAPDDQALLLQCDIHFYKSSGPGGQHRNKVSSAVRLKHRPTGVSAHGDDSRSQHQNKEMAIRRLRMNLACQIRRQLTPPILDLPDYIKECIFRSRGKQAGDNVRLEIGVKDHRFWHIAAYLLYVMQACQGKVSDAAAILGITTGNFAALLNSHRHLLTAAQQIRKQFGLSLLKF